MIKKSQSIITKLYPVCFIILILVIWQVVSVLEIVPPYMLPSPLKVVSALIHEFPTLLRHSAISLGEAFAGLFLSIIFSFTAGVLMDRFEFLYKGLYPVAILTQTIPSIAIAPLLVLWMGYGVLPKIALIFITCFFPLLIGILDGFKSADQNVIRMYRSMNASYFKILTDVKMPYSLESFFSGLKISASYSVVGAVISEWLGGKGGLGVYMTHVRKAYAFDKMFAVIFLISIISLLLMEVVKLLQRGVMPWKKGE